MGASVAPLRRTLVATATLFVVGLVVRAGFATDGPWGPLEGVGLATIVVVAVLPRLVEEHLTTLQEGLSVALAGSICVGIGAGAARSDGGQITPGLLLAGTACLVVAAGFVCWAHRSGHDRA